MDNKFSEKVHVGIRRERQKNGDIYPESRLMRPLHFPNAEHGKK